MKKINYKTLTIQNFLSVGNEAIVIDFQRGLNLISGENKDYPERKNAIGKSTMPEGFYFAVFGETIRKLKKEFIINNIVGGKGRVELEFDIQDSKGIASYKIIRQVKPAKVELWKGDEDITLSSIAETNQYICDLLSTNNVICRSCDILTLGDKKNPPFLDKDAAEKRKFIEDIFSLEVFTKMIKDLKIQIKDNKSDISVSEAKIEELGFTAETLKKQEEKYLKELAEREENLQKKKEDLNQKLEKLYRKVDSSKPLDIKPLEEEKTKFEDALDKINVVLTKKKEEESSLNTQYKLKKQEIAKVDSVGGAECDKCLQKIPHTHIEQLSELKESKEEELNHIGTQMGVVSAKILDLESRITKAKKKIRDLNNNITDAKIIANQYISDMANIESLEKRIEDVEEEMAKTVEGNNTFSESIKETNERKEKELKNNKSLKNLAEDLKVCSFILGDEGVKSFVVKQLLRMLNGSIQQYINDLGMNIICEFDEYFDEQMKNSVGKEICYQNLSGAERMTVDLACAWAFKDIKEKISGVSSNLEWNDEILDSIMDTVGLDKLVDVIKERIEKYNLCLYAVSHRQELQKHIDGEVVMLEMENKLTRRVD